MIEKGVPPDTIWGFHTGLSERRILALHWALRKREIERDQTAVHSMAIAVRSIMDGGKELKKLDRNVEGALGRIDLVGKHKEEQAAEAASALAAALGGVTMTKSKGPFIG